MFTYSYKACQETEVYIFTKRSDGTYLVPVDFSTDQTSPRDEKTNSFRRNDWLVEKWI